MNWQRTNLQAAASYMRERMAAGATDVRTRTVYEGLLDVLDPTRRLVRLQREASAAQAAVAVPVARERRARMERRGNRNRRQVSMGPPAGSERRTGRDRRSGRDRRGG